MSFVKVRRVGNSLGILIPAKDLKAADVKIDDVLELVVDGLGHLSLQKSSEAKKAATVFMDKYDDAFRKLGGS
jgi:antitoxin component of MazEF toxin-antitoxin module